MKKLITLIFIVCTLLSSVCYAGKYDDFTLLDESEELISYVNKNNTLLSVGKDINLNDFVVYTPLGKFFSLPAIYVERSKEEMDYSPLVIIDISIHRDFYVMHSSSDEEKDYKAGTISSSKMISHFYDALNLSSLKDAFEPDISRWICILKHPQKDIVYWVDSTSIIFSKLYYGDSMNFWYMETEPTSKNTQMYNLEVDITNRKYKILSYVKNENDKVSSFDLPSPTWNRIIPGSVMETIVFDAVKLKK